VECHHSTSPAKRTRRSGRELQTSQKSWWCLSARARPAGMALLLNPPTPQRGDSPILPAGPPHAGTSFSAASVASCAPSQLAPRPALPAPPLRGLPRNPGARPASRARLRLVAGLPHEQARQPLVRQRARYSLPSAFRWLSAFCAGPCGPLGRSPARSAAFGCACVRRASGEAGSAERDPAHPASMRRSAAKEKRRSVFFPCVCRTVAVGG
jgi:hypothetical protein